MEAYVHGACAAGDAEALLLQLRMCCDPRATLLVEYEEEVWEAARVSLTGGGGARRKASGLLWRVRRSRSAVLADVAGGDRGGAALCDLPAAARARPAPTVAIAERTARRGAARGVGFRHRTASGVAECTGAGGMLRGLGLARRAGAARTVRGRRYAHPSGADVFVLASRVGGAPEHAGLLVELAAAAPDPDAEAAVGARLLAARASLAPHLVPLDE